LGNGAVFPFPFPLTATNLNDLAALYLEKGDYAKAEPLLKEVLEIRQKVLGREHPDTAQSQNNLAELYRTTRTYCTTSVPLCSW
jgi:hypothetical protein